MVQCTHLCESRLGNVLLFIVVVIIPQLQIRSMGIYIGSCYTHNPFYYIHNPFHYMHNPLKINSCLDCEGYNLKSKQACKLVLDCEKWN